MKIFKTGVAKFIEEGEATYDSRLGTSSFKFAKTKGILPDNTLGDFQGSERIEIAGNGQGVVNEVQQQIEFHFDSFNQSLGSINGDP